MRPIDKVSCPYTYRVLDDEHKGWCTDVAGKHCEGKDCPWKVGKADAKKEAPVQAGLFDKSK